MFDGEPCMSQGFEVTDCHPFKVPTGLNNTLLLDIRYQPDFTISYVRKRLSLVTNIGDLEYIVEVRIPHHMLSVCHDSLPRPPLETYLFYLCFGLLSFMVVVMLLSSFFESKSILKYQYNVYKKICTENEEEEKVKQNINEEKTRAKSSSNSETLAKPPKSPKAHRNLAKSSSSPKTNEKTKLSKKNKEKESDSFGFPPLIFETKPIVEKKEKRIMNGSVTPPLPSVDLTKQAKQKTSKQVKQTNKVQTNSSGNNSSSSSGTSTPSPPPSVSPVQFLTQPKAKKQRSKQLNKPVYFKPQTKSEIINCSSETNQTIENLNEATNNLNSNLNNLSSFLNAQNELNSFVNNNQANSIPTNNPVDLTGLLSLNLNPDILNLINLLNFQNNFELTQTDYLNEQLNRLQLLNQEQTLRQMSYLNNNDLGTNYLPSSSFSNNLFDQELSNILINNPNQLVQENDGECKFRIKVFINLNFFYICVLFLSGFS